MDADEIIARYGLTPHPEGGHYREIFRADAEEGGRGAVTSIYYLLRAGDVSAWHRVDAVEIWHYHAGDALRLEISADGEETTGHRLGVGEGARAPGVVPAGGGPRVAGGAGARAPGPRSWFPSAPGRARVRRVPGLWWAAR